MNQPQDFNQPQDMNSGLGSLTGTVGSLKHQARSKNLRSARISLVIAGIITLILGQRTTSLAKSSSTI
jgi:hypothetical protein